MPAESGSRLMHWLRRILDWVKRRLTPLLSAIRPGPHAWNGAAAGLAVGTVLILLVCFYGLVVASGFGLGPLLAFCMLIGVAMVAGVVIRWLFALPMLLPNRYRWSLLLCLPPLVLLFMRAGGFLTTMRLLLAIVVPASLIGAAVWALARSGMRGLTRAQLGVAVGGLGLGLVAAGFVLHWVVKDGRDAEPYRNAAVEAVAPVKILSQPDPSRRGDHEVLTLTYGSGSDRHRPEYGRDVDVVTEPVDGSPFIDQWDGWSGWARTRYWGFDAEELPLQGRVWYPDGDGPFPLVLVVHGNHGMEDYSDPGYDYLGELLASRAFILVSVDENFLNSSMGDLLSGFDGGLDEENDARGWVLLEHLRQWRLWAQDSASPFFQKVDLASVGLIGHSRGGEAVAIAAAFNRLPFYPDDATVAFDYGFEIRAVVAIAPIDGQYRPGERGTPIENVNYFVLHGANDGDVSSFSGLSQYERVKFTDRQYWFKAALYVLGANHGQFNTSWGRSDAGEPFGRFLNLRSLMPAEEQEQIAEVYISAFLEASLRDNTDLIPLFWDHRRADDWLPETVYLHQFEDTRCRFVSTYEEDIDVTTGSLDGTQLSTEHLTLWREQRVRLKRRLTETSAVYLGWDSAGAEGVASYTVTLPDSPAPDDLRSDLVASSSLMFALADADEDPNPGDEDGEEEDEEQPEPLDLTVELRDTAGEVARLPLSSFSLLQPQIKVDVAKSEFLESGNKSEVVFQTFVFTLAQFQAENPSLDLKRLAQIRFVFDRSSKGAVVLDNVGFRL
jgi:dienelactone hydrolase